MDYEEILARREQAHKVVSNMCNGDHKWLMSIPVDPKRDSDTLICNSLRDIPALIEELKGKYPHDMTHEQWWHYLAAKAMELMLKNIKSDQVRSMQDLAEQAYKMADAMLKEGEKDAK